MYCIKCGKELQDGERFCTACGTPAFRASSPPKELQPDIVVIPKTEKASEEAASSDAPATNDEGSPSCPDQPTSPTHTPGRTETTSIPLGKTAPHPPTGTPTAQDKPTPATADDGARRNRTRALLVAVAAALVVAVAVAGLVAIGNRPDTPSTAALDLADVEDEQFRSYLADLADADGDGTISAEEAAQVTQMGSYENGEASGGPSGMNITSLRGIEQFTNLKTLVCTDNDIDVVDLTANTALEHVICSGSGVGELKLPSGGSLTTLHATDNELESIDLSHSDGLTDVELDEGVTIAGGALPSEEAQDHTSDMTLAFCVAQVFDASTKVDGDLVTAPGTSASADSHLILSMVYPVGFSTPRIRRGQVNYGFEYEGTHPGYAIPLETGEAVLDSFYGSHPDDLSYIDGDALDYTGSGWTTNGADGPFARTIATSNWFSYGRLVAFDAELDYMDGESEAYTYTYRVVVVEDEDSAFGYHMVSMLLQDFDGTSGGGMDTATSNSNASGSTDANTGTQATTSPKPSSQPSSSNTNGYDFDLHNILGTHVATFEGTEDRYGYEHNCYAGRATPLTIDVKGLDEDRMTITYDVTMVLHGHYIPDNVQDATEGDVTVTLTDVQSRIKIGKGRQEAYFSSKDSMVTDYVTPRIYFTISKSGAWDIVVDSVYFPTQDSAGFGLTDNYAIDLA